jgi:hypothetical protein
VLITGNSKIGKTSLLNILSERTGSPIVNVGSKLGHLLRSVPFRKRNFEVAVILRELANSYTVNDLLLLDNIEILFDRSLQLDPLDLIKQNAHSRRIVAVWPGEFRRELSIGRLTYAELGHPEHQDYSFAGFVPFEI